MNHFLAPEEIKKLKVEAQITTVDDIWRTMNDDLDKGIDHIVKRTSISPTVLFDFLVSELLREMDGKNQLWIVKWWTNFKLHTLDVILVLMALILVWLTLRAGVAPTGVNSPLESQTAVIVAARDLEPGSTINNQDLLSVRLAPQNGYFKTDDALEGLIVGKRVPRQKPIRYSDVLRFQVVAAADIPVGAQLDNNNVKMSWSSYRPNAFTSMDPLKHLKARIAIQTGSVLTTEAVQSISVGDQTTNER